MIAIIALVLQVLIGLVIPSANAVEVTVIPPMPAYSPSVIASVSDDEDGYWCAEYDKAEDEFTALFNSYSYKLSKNGRSMINGKFVKMGV